MVNIDKIAEAYILEAIEKGELDNLAGMGKPLELEDLSHVPEELRMAYKILKNAGCVPEEVQLRKDIMQLQTLLQTVDDEKTRTQAVKRLNLLFAKLGNQRAGSLQAMDTQYYQKTVDKLLSE
ncbi:DnaJ family domain-containing protein [Beggiatoa leptomitoformis]|uniref:DUF1992 domain-containing protein n=1 Tax=Beggiatoa leptomitoformis TaxID=288004 RepID=A0A2N9YE85_9GAMM|nr:DnaJ family domain-containing protein [Beggiatoa leptomitoformis]ALG68874.1 DUF1992 domain-containing protein [Beggiatoa leptomitoformis]AUI68756.1 DUF1992 domain-containing protein [Beggiatoa leptomitoformis]